MAFGNPSGALAGLGVTFVFDRVFVLDSKYGDKTYSTTQQRLGAGLRYRLPLGNRPTLPTLHVGVGYNKISFLIDRGGDVVPLPDSDYTYIDPGLGVRYPLGTPRLALLADARYMLVLSDGDFSNAANYGTSTVAGIDVDAGLEFRLMPRLPIHAGFRYTRIAYTINGDGDLSNNLDGNPNTQDVGGALDVYLGGYVTAGYIF
jgi:opacity protein-like surface antigen